MKVLISVLKRSRGKHTMSRSNNGHRHRTRGWCRFIAVWGTRGRSRFITVWECIMKRHSRVTGSSNRFVNWMHTVKPVIVTFIIYSVPPWRRPSILSCWISHLANFQMNRVDVQAQIFLPIKAFTANVTHMIPETIANWSYYTLIPLYYII